MRATLKEKFEQVALPHLDAVHRMASCLAKDRSEADDLVQETFIRAYRAFGGFDLREFGSRPWLMKILHNVFYTLKGKQRRGPSLLDDVDFDGFSDELDQAQLEPDTAGGINWDSFDEELKQAVGELRTEYRTVLLLWAIEGLSYKEIARICDCAIGTVMSRLYRARQLLGIQLKEYARRRNLSTERFAQ